MKAYQNGIPSKENIEGVHWGVEKAQELNHAYDYFSNFKI